MMLDHERNAVAMYAVAARDASDFLDMVGEASTASLQTLHEMVTLENPKHDADTRKLNALLVSIVGQVLARRAIAKAERTS